MPLPSPTSLRKAFADICRGYSLVPRDGKASLYVKHLTPFDQTDVDDYYDAALARARKKGIPSEEQRRKWLAKKGLWTKADDRDLAMQADFVKNAELTKTKAWIKTQIDAQEAVLVVERAKLASMTQKRDSLIGLTDERAATQKMQFYYIHLSFFGDSSLKTRLYDMPTMDEMDEDESYDLLSLYMAFVGRFDSPVIRRLAVSPIFSNSFHLCGDNLTQFFGKPVVDLSFYQSNLLSYGLYFKNVMSHEPIPPDCREDPDKIEDYINKSAAAKAALKTSMEGGATGVVGASSEDFKSMGMTEDTKGLHMQKRE